MFPPSVTDCMFPHLARYMIIPPGELHVLQIQNYCCYPDITQSRWMDSSWTPENTLVQTNTSNHQTIAVDNNSDPRKELICFGPLNFCINGNWLSWAKPHMDNDVKDDHGPPGWIRTCDPLMKVLKLDSSGPVQDARIGK